MPDVPEAGCVVPKPVPEVASALDTLRVGAPGRQHVSVAYSSRS